MKTASQITDDMVALQAQKQLKQLNMDAENPPEILLDKDGHEPWPNGISPARSRTMTATEWLDTKMQVEIGRSAYFSKKINLLQSKQDRMKEFVEHLKESSAKLQKPATKPKFIPFMQKSEPRSSAREVIYSSRLGRSRLYSQDQDSKTTSREFQLSSRLWSK